VRRSIPPSAGKLATVKACGTRHWTSSCSLGRRAKPSRDGPGRPSSQQRGCASSKSRSSVRLEYASRRAGHQLPGNYRASPADGRGGSRGASLWACRPRGGRVVVGRRRPAGDFHPGDVAAGCTDGVRAPDGINGRLAPSRPSSYAPTNAIDRIERRRLPDAVGG